MRYDTPFVVVTIIGLAALVGSIGYKVYNLQTAEKVCKTVPVFRTERIPVKSRDGDTVVTYKETQIGTKEVCVEKWLDERYATQGPPEPRPPELSAEQRAQQFLESQPKTEDLTNPCHDKPGWKYEYYLPPDYKAEYEVHFKLWILGEDEVNHICQKAEGCWLRSATGHLNLLIIPAPKDFNDRRVLCILGHEVMHELGADHESIKGFPPLRPE